MLLCKLHEGVKAGLPTGEMENNIYLEGILLQRGSTDQVGPGTRAVEITSHLLGGLRSLVAGIAMLGPTLVATAASTPKLFHCITTWISLKNQLKNTTSVKLPISEESD